MSEKRFVGGIAALAAICLIAGLTGCAAREVEKDMVFKTDLSRLMDEDPIEREIALIEIVDAGADAAPFLRKAATSDEDPAIRRVAIHTLGDLARRDKQAAGKVNEAMIAIYMRNDPETVATAEIVMRERGAEVLPRLAQIASAMPTDVRGEEPPWIHPVSLMISIDRSATIAEFIGMLGEPEYADRENTLNRILENITRQTFNYDPDADAETRSRVVRRWKEWWEIIGR